MDDELPRRADKKCFEYFARAESWTIHEAVILLLGFDPRDPLADDSTQIQEARPYLDLTKLIRRARSDFASTERVTPTELINWAMKNDYKVSVGLVYAVSEARRRSRLRKPFLTDEEPQPARTGETLHHKSRTSLLRLVAGMAVRGYSYDPSSTRSDVISDIESDLRLLNIPLSDDTIRKWLAEACEQIDWETVDPSVQAESKKSDPK